MSVNRAYLKRIAVLGLALGSMATYVDCPSNQQPTLTCLDFSLTLDPGMCRRFANPCGNHEWISPPRTDGFRLFGEPSSIYVKTERSGGVTTRSVCSAPGGSPIVAESIPFEYAPMNSPAYGTGHLTLTVGPRLDVSASATPTTINAGDQSQLVAQASGGVPPYSYLWIPTSGLNEAHIPAPLASPSVTTNYVATVTDAAGQTRSASVTVSVNFDLVVSADPNIVNPGDVSQLNTTQIGGAPPFSFAWTPIESLDDPAITDPLSSPPITTTYTAIVTDSLGVSRSGSVEVTVRLFANPSASPGTINAGQATQLDANQIGGDGSYTYAWSPATGLTDPAIRNPVASPSTTTTYTVVVTDGHGLSATGQVPVTVNAADPAPTASFTFTRVPCSVTAPCSNGATLGQEVFLDGSNSAGNIVSYTWEFDWTPASPDAISSGPTTSVVLEEGNQRGNIILTVTAADGRTSSFSRRFP